MQERKSLARMPEKFEYNLSDYLTYTPKYPDIKKLMELADIILTFACPAAENVENLIIRLNSIKNNPQFNQTYREWAESKIKLFLCKKCKSNPSKKLEFPYYLCQGCLEYAEKKSKCRMCQASLKHEQFSSACRHLCLFCACINLKNGKNGCPVCNFDFSNLKFKRTSCDNCVKNKNKTFFDDSVFFLRCGHSLCCDCLKICVKNKKCVIDGKAIPEKTKNYIINYISSVCYNCNQRKYWNRIVLKTCCPRIVCIKCQGNRPVCLGCKPN